MICYEHVCYKEKKSAWPWNVWIITAFKNSSTSVQRQGRLIQCHLLFPQTCLLTIFSTKKGRMWEIFTPKNCSRKKREKNSGDPLQVHSLRLSVPLTTNPPFGWYEERWRPTPFFFLQFLLYFVITLFLKVIQPVQPDTFHQQAIMRTAAFFRERILLLGNRKHGVDVFIGRKMNPLTPI